MIDVKERLYLEFKNEILNLRGMEMGSEKYKASVDGITKIADRLIAIDEKERANEMNRKKARDEKIDRWISLVLAALKLGASIGVPVWITIVSMGFEHSETMTYTAGRESVKDCLALIKKL
jgi:hypothetical protein